MTRFVDNVYLRGGGLSKQLAEAVTSASFSASLTDISQVDITFTDPGWALLKSGIFSINASVDIESYQMEIASISTGSDADEVENVNIKCRSRVIRKLKNRRGARVMRNVSPSEFVISECKAVGAKYRVQGSSKRKQVARDVPKDGQQEVSNPPSSWTTFKRLADEVGFVMFETAGVIYFGKPSWLISEGGSAWQYFRYKSGKDDNGRVYSVPEADRSEDSTAESVKFTVHTNSLDWVKVGGRFNLSGVPTFETNYLVSSVSIDMTDPRNLVDVTGVLASNPDPSDTAKGQSRRGTQLRSDFVYWVRKQIGNRYADTQVGLGSNNPNTFDGDELAQWAASQVGIYLPETANLQIEFCESHGTLISVASAAKIAGTLLWRNNSIGISLGNGQIVESVRGKVGIRKGGATSRYSRAGKIPSMLY